MLKRFLLILAVCTLASAAHAERATIVVLGDSLTSGYQLPANEAYPAVLQQVLRSRGYKQTEVINMSLAGETASNAYKRVPDVLAKKPDVVIIQLGLNDALSGMDPGTQINTSLQNIIHTFSRRRIYTLLLGTKLPATLGKMKSRDYTLVMHALVKNYQIAFYPDVMEGIAGNPKLLLLDRFHPNADGVKRMVWNTLPLIEPTVRWKQKHEDYQRKLKE